MLDRQSSIVAKKMVESYLPDPEIRNRCLNALVESILFVHKHNDSAWGLTLRKYGVRLNVGRIEVFVIGYNKNGIYFVVDEDFLEENQLRLLHETNSIAGPYSSITASRRVNLHAERLDRDFDFL